MHRQQGHKHLAVRKLFAVFSVSQRNLCSGNPAARCENRPLYIRYQSLYQVCVCKPGEVELSCSCWQENPSRKSLSPFSHSSFSAPNSAFIYYIFSYNQPTQVVVFSSFLLRFCQLGVGRTIFSFLSTNLPLNLQWSMPFSILKTFF